VRVARLILAAAVFLTPVLAQSVTVQMQRATYLEETAGDLEGAIQIYRQILAAGADARMYEAEAQFRLGACLLKKGDKPLAARAFQQLMQTHPEATNLVAQASTHFLDTEVGYSFTVPLGWTIVSHRPSQGPGTCVNLQDPESQATVGICAKSEAVAANGIDARMAKGEAEFVQNFQSGYAEFAIRPGSPAKGTLAGQHTLTLIADYRDAFQGQGRTVWATWVQTGATRSSVVVRVPSQKFDDFRSRFTPILNSYRIP
jgi:tetratricopeptide (TPR) repeat protein